MKLFVLLIFSGAYFACNGAILYVTETGAGTNDGSSWTNAYSAGSLQMAINAANPGDEVWLACGIYFPTTTNRSISF